MLKLVSVSFVMSLLFPGFLTQSPSLVMATTLLPLYSCPHPALARTWHHHQVEDVHIPLSPCPPLPCGCPPLPTVVWHSHTGPVTWAVAFHSPLGLWHRPITHPKRHCLLWQCHSHPSCVSQSPKQLQGTLLSSLSPIPHTSSKLPFLCVTWRGAEFFTLKYALWHKDYVRLVKWP